MIDNKPMVNLVRNAMASGIAAFTDRMRAGTLDPTGSVLDMVPATDAESFLTIRSELLDAASSPIVGRALREAADELERQMAEADEPGWREQESVHQRTLTFLRYRALSLDPTSESPDAQV